MASIAALALLLPERDAAENGIGDEDEEEEEEEEEDIEEEEGGACAALDSAMRRILWAVATMCSSMWKYWKAVCCAVWVRGKYSGYSGGCTCTRGGLPARSSSATAARSSTPPMTTVATRSKRRPTNSCSSVEVEVLNPSPAVG